MASLAGKAGILKIIKIEKASVTTEVESIAVQSRQSTKSRNKQQQEVVVSITKELSPLPTEEKSIGLKSATSAKKSSVATQSKKSQKTATSIEDKQPLPEEKVKRILPPIPTRTPEELQAAIENYEREWRISQPQRIPALAGTVSANLNEEGRPRLFPRQVRIISTSIIQKLLSDPAIATPTWFVLLDETISIGTKIRQLQAIGWEPEIMPIKGFREICLLARILSIGVD
jgi:hypothetical protein